MGAKKKLNAANFLGALFVASLVAGVTGSWSAFWISLAALLFAGLVAGDIRK